MSESIPDAEHSRFVRAPFMARMERELSAPENMAKGDWRTLSPDRWQIMHELRMHILKLSLALESGDRDLVSHHAADLAVLAMKTSEMHGID